MIKLAGGDGSTFYSLLEAADPAVSYGRALLLTSPAVVAAAFAESIRSHINDNIRVGVVAAIALVLLHSFRPL